MYPKNPKLLPAVRALRKNMTPEERHLWYDFLKGLPFTVKRQMNIENYILDFYIPSSKIAIEVDGNQHLEKGHYISDRIRDRRLRYWGITVLRYSNEDIRERFEWVTSDILERMGRDRSDPKNKF